MLKSGAENKFYKSPELFASLLPTIGIVVFYTLSLQIDFAHHDQYRYFNNNTELKICELDTQFKGLFFDLGRPFGALVECLIFKNVRTIEDLTRWRVVCCLVLAVTLVVLSKICLKLREENPNLQYQVIIPWLILIPVLPGIQYLVQMTNLANLLSMLAACLSFYLFNFSFTKNPQSKTTNPKSYKFVNYALPIPLLLISLFTYPAISTIYIALTSLRVLLICENNGFMRIAKVIVWNSVLFIICTLFFIFITKFVLHPYVDYVPNDGAYGFQFSIPSFQRLTFALAYFIKAASVWDIYSNQYIFWFIVLSNISAMLVFSDGLELSRRLLKLALWFASIVSLTIAVTITNFQEPLFRIMVPLMLFLSFHTFVFIDRFVAQAEKWLSKVNRYQISVSFYVLVMLVGAISFYSTANWHSSIMSSRAEFEYVKQRLSEWDGRKILIIKNVERDKATRSFLNKNPIGDEFNINTTVYSAAEIGFVLSSILNEHSQNYNILHCSNECLSRPQKISQREIFYAKKPYSFKTEDEHFVIDMIPFTVRDLSELEPDKLDEYGFPENLSVQDVYSFEKLNDQQKDLIDHLSDLNPSTFVEFKLSNMNMENTEQTNNKKIAIKQIDLGHLKHPTKTLGIYHGNHGTDSFNRAPHQLVVHYKNGLTERVCTSKFLINIKRHGWTTISLEKAVKTKDFFITKIDLYFSNEINRFYDLVPFEGKIFDNLKNKISQNYQMSLLQLTADNFEECSGEN